MSAYIFALLYQEEIRRRSMRRERVFRTREDAFAIPDSSFLKLYKLPKDVVMGICNSLQSELQPVSGVRTALTVEIKVLCALRFYATGSHQRCVGQERTLGISQATVSKVVTAVSQAINKVLLHQTICFPNESEYSEIKVCFMNAAGFPGVIGAIDGTHVAIIAPAENDVHQQKDYLNGKGYHSINVQLVCDTDMKILNINAKYPGSTPDAFVWQYSVLRNILRSENLKCIPKGWLLGDSGYPLEPWLLTPILHPSTSAEENYNRHHAHSRNIIERCSNVLKSRFRCLSNQRALRYNPTTASHIINSCAVLHNLCVKHKVIAQEEESFPSVAENENVQHVVCKRATDLRQHIIRTHFTK